VTANASSGGIAFVAHVAGFVAGLLGVFVFRKRRTAEYWTER
jgi:membrane associated rhomboid family serine protease